MASTFAVGNHIAFGPGEYDPKSPEGQHLIAHEVVHTLQQPDAEMSMMPKADLDVEIDPDPKAEREADEIAGEVMKGGEVGMTKSWQADVHVQRSAKGKMFGALAVFELENEEGSVGPFQQEQNEARSEKMREWIEQYNEDTNEVERKLNQVAAQDLIKTEAAANGATVTDGRLEGPKEVTDGYFDHEEAKEVLQKELPSKSKLEQRKKEIEGELEEKLEQVALTDSQRDKLDAGVERGLLGKLGEKVGFGLLKKIDPTFTVVNAGYKVVKNNWGMVDGDIVERAMKLREELLDEYVQEMEPGSDVDPTGVRGGK